MRLNEDGKTARALDVLVPRIGEIIGGSQREERRDVLLERIRQSGLDEKNYWWYLASSAPFNSSPGSLISETLSPSPGPPTTPSSRPGPG